MVINEHVTHCNSVANVCLLFNRVWKTMTLYSTEDLAISSFGKKTILLNMINLLLSLAFNGTC